MDILNSNQTLELWQLGKRIWNSRMKLGHIAEVTFTGNLDGHEYNFENCYFPAKTNFKNVKFIRSNNEEIICFKKASFQEVEFVEVNFHHGPISFENTIFKGQANFKNLKFSEANFRGAKFYETANFSDTDFLTNTDFDKAIFKKQAIFSNAAFKNSSFMKTKFNEQAEFSDASFDIRTDFFSAEFKGQTTFSKVAFKQVDFVKAKFDGPANFLKTTFEDDVRFDGIESKSDINFHAATFKKSVNFFQSKFSENTDFIFAKFLGETRFDGSKFGRENKFEYTTFDDNTYFNDITASEAHSFSFRGATFGKIFSIKSNKKIGCVIDFIDTQAKYSLHLGDISCTFRQEHKWLSNRKWLSNILKCLLSGFQTPEDSDDISRLRKLKKVAQEEKDHLRALDYKVQEMQAKRWQDNVDETTWRLSKLIKAFPEFVFWAY